MFTAVCPHCSQTYTLADSLLDKRATCKQCRNVFVLEKGTMPLSTVTHINDIIAEGHGDLDFQLQHTGTPLPSKQPEPFDADTGLWNVGDLILGVYEVRPIAEGIPHAEGGVGVVHRIYHREWDMDLAVKSPKPKFFQTEHGKKSYEQEAQTWIELGLHPNIVTCYLVRRIGGIPRLFAEFVPDGSLRDWILDGRLYLGHQDKALLRILNIAIQFAWGLDHAHRQSLLHLDVKPANVMMSGRTAKVADFGLAQTAVGDGADSNHYITVGMTPGYCSPEQYLAVDMIKKQQFDNLPKMTVQTDMWSWAVSVLGMFYGGPPCNRAGGQNARKVCEKFLESPPEKKFETIPNIPENVAELLMHCFELEPQHRPDSMDHVADRLTEIYKDVSGTDFPRPKPINATWTPDTINNRAISLLDLHKPDEAAKLFNQAIAKQPWHPEVTYNRTILSWRLGQQTDRAAVQQLETLIKMRPQFSGAVYGLGLAHRERGKLTSALEAFRNALAMEDREDIRRAIFAAETLLPDEARCMQSFTLGDAPGRMVYVENGGEYMLCYREPETLAHYSTISGELRRTFKIEKPGTNDVRGVLSSDLFWKLSPSPDGFIVQRAEPPHETYTFRQINWGRPFGNEKATRQVLLPEKSLLGVAVEHRVDITNISTKEKVGTLLGHEDDVTALAFCFGGTFAMTAAEDRTVRIWELPSCRCVRTFTVPKQTIDAVYLDTNGHFALSVTMNGLLRLWSTTLLCRPNAFRSPLQLSRVTSAEEAGRQQSEMEQLCNEIRQAVRQEDYAAALDWMEKAKKLNGWESARYALEVEGVGDIIRRRTMRESFDSALCTHRLSGHPDAVTSLAVSRDANIIASAGKDGEIRVWNIAEQKCIADLDGHEDEVRSITMTEDAKFVVSGSRDGTIRIWNIASAKCIRTFGERIMTFTKAAIHPKEKAIAIADGSGEIRLWEILTDTVIDRWTCPSGVSAIQFSRGGAYIAAGDNAGTVTVWTVANGKSSNEKPTHIFQDHKAPITAIALAPDKGRCFSADKSGRIAINNLLTEKQEYYLQEHADEVSGLEVLSDSRFFFSGAKDGSVKVWRLTQQTTTGAMIWSAIEGHPSAVTSMRLDISGRRLVTGDAEGVVRVWELLWQHSFPGWKPMSKEAEEMLRSLVSFYSEDGATMVNRILLEMDYCGFGTIPQDTLRQALTTYTQSPVR